MGADPFGTRFSGGLDGLFTRFFRGRDPCAAVGFGSRDAVGSPAVQRVDLSRLLDDAARKRTHRGNPEDSHRPMGVPAVPALLGASLPTGTS